MNRVQAQPKLSIGGQTFEHIVSRDLVSIYVANDVYLRIGPEQVLRPEMEAHQRMHVLEFPVLPVLNSGQHQGSFYYTEASAGETFGDLFDNQAGQLGDIQETSFAAFLQIVLNYANTQLQHRTQEEPVDTFRRMIKASEAATALPEVADMTVRAFDLAAERLAIFPAVLTHGDFHAFNICEWGVIDFERVAYGFAGYDVVTAILLPGLLPPAADEYSFSPEQIEHALSAIDTIYQEQGLPGPSAFSRDYLICKMMWLVAGRKRPPELLTWLDDRYRAMLAAYLSAE